MDRREMASGVVRAVGFLLLVVAAIHLAATPLVKQTVLDRVLSERMLPIVAPPFLLNHVVVGILLVPLGLVTVHCAGGIRAGQRWAWVAAWMVAACLPLLPLALVLVMREGPFDAWLFRVAQVLVTICATAMPGVLLWARHELPRGASGPGGIRWIRPLAICVFRDAGRILVGHGRDAVKGESFMRPLGGRIEPGERAADALRREIREELQAEIDEPELLGVLENLFAYEGEAHHEIVFVFDARFRDRSLYARGELPIAERVWQGPATWLSLDGLGEAGTSLYPKGLRELLSVRGVQSAS